MYSIYPEKQIIPSLDEILLAIYNSSYWQKLEKSTTREIFQNTHNMKN